MSAEERLLVRCDAPHCGAVLEGADGTTLFASLEEVRAVVLEQDWLLNPSWDGEEKAYCRLHWHRQFGVRTPYWGRRKRRYEW